MRASFGLLPAVAWSLLLVTALPAAGQQGTQRLSLDMYLKWESVQNPQLSPDGKQIVYTRSWNNPMTDRAQSSLWIMNADGSRNRFLMDGSSPIWSPDGTRIAFLAPGSPQGRQIFVRWMDDEGAVSQVTRLTQSPNDIEWSPDGRFLQFVALVPEELDPSWRIALPARPEGARWTEAPRIEDRLDYRFDGTGWSPRGHEHIFVVSADGGLPRQITQGDWKYVSGTQTRPASGVAAVRWMPDGRSLVFHSLIAEDADYRTGESHIYSVDVATGTVKQLTSKRGPFEEPVPSPDGRLIAFQGQDFNDAHYRENELYIMNSDGSNIRTVARELGETFQNVTWAPDSRGLYFNSAMKGTQNLWFAPLDGEPRAISTGQHMLGMASMAGTLVAGTRSGPQRPSSLVTFDVSQPANVRTLYASNQPLLESVKLGEVEEIWYKSLNDLMVQGWIVKPPDFDRARKYPLILQIHGCARGMYNFGFDFGAQEMAANGYVVLYTNPRGSSGYGSAFGNETYLDFPGEDYDDLMTGVDTLLARGYIDQRNLFVQGASGGGVLTGWIVGHTQRFTAAVARAMVSDFFSWAGTVDRSRWFSDTFAKTPWDDPQERLRRSPIMYVNNVTTPTLVMTGELDLRTPVSQAEEFYRALRMRKVPTAMIRIADAYHNQGATLSNFMRVQLYMRNWFERFMVRDGTTNSGALQQAARTESPGSAAATAAATLTEAAHADGVAPYGVECVNYK